MCSVVPYCAVLPTQPSHPKWPPLVRFITVYNVFQLLLYLSDALILDSMFIMAATFSWGWGVTSAIAIANLSKHYQFRWTTVSKWLSVQFQNHQRFSDWHWHALYIEAVVVWTQGRLTPQGWLHCSSFNDVYGTQMFEKPCWTTRYYDKYSFWNQTNGNVFKYFEIRATLRQFFLQSTVVLKVLSECFSLFIGKNDFD